MINAASPTFAAVIRIKTATELYGDFTIGLRRRLGFITLTSATSRKPPPMRADNELVGTVQDSVFENLRGRTEYLLREPVAFAVGVVTEAKEALFDAQPGGGTEVIDQLQQCFVFFASARRAETVGAGAGRGDREHFGANIDKAAEQDLFALELRPEFCHGMEETARELAAGCLCVAEMFLQDRRHWAI